MDNVEGAPKSNVLGIVALVTGILSVVFALCCGWIGIILGVVAIICGFLGKKENQQFAMIGIILGGIGVVLAVVFMIIFALGGTFLSNFIDNLMREFDFEF